MSSDPADGLVKVAWAANQAEAELIEGMLAAEGIASTHRRQRGFDVPDYLAAGPRDVFVAAEFAEAAHELLADPGAPGPSPAAEDRRPAALAPVLFVATLVVILVIVALYLSAR